MGAGVGQLAHPWYPAASHLEGRAWCWQQWRWEGRLPEGSCRSGEPLCAPGRDQGAQLLRSLGGECEESRNLGVLSGFDFFPQFSIRKNLKPETLDKKNSTINDSDPSLRFTNVSILYTLSWCVYVFIHICTFFFLCGTIWKSLADTLTLNTFA